MVIGERLRAVRQQMNLTQRDLEKRTGIPQRSISILENSRGVPSLRTLERLAKGLRVPLYLFFYTGLDALRGQRPKGHKRSFYPREEAEVFDKLLRLFDQTGPFDRQLLLSTALEMARRGPTSRVHR